MSSDAGPAVTVEQLGDGVSLLTLNRPSRKNALSIALRDQMSDALAVLADDPNSRVVVITGSGDTFSAGFDLGEFTQDDPGHVERLWLSSDRFHHAVLRFPLPTIAAVNGAAIAGGFDLAVLADIRIAATSAWFSHPERVWSDVVYRPLRELVGGSAARYLTLTGRRIDADEALTLGLVNVVVPKDALVAHATAMAVEIAVAPRDVLVRAKAKIIAATNIAADIRTLDL
jgi:enoyl-CoA hydratase/carnithine racemase